MILIFDIGNTHTHCGLAGKSGIIKHLDVPTQAWLKGEAAALVKKFVKKHPVSGVALCSVVPQANPCVRQFAQKTFKQQVLELSPDNLTIIGIDYPHPETIGPDRLANAIAVTHHYGAPAIVVDFGTAVTFDIIDHQRNYIGGVIAPGLSAMTDYLHEKTALLPRVKIRDTHTSIGKSTEEAMLIGAVHGYRGMVKQLLHELKAELGCRSLPVVATGGYAALIAKGVPEIDAVEPNLTLEGVRLAWMANH